MKKESETVVFNKLADSYKSIKYNTIMNLLKGGKILYDAKEAMPHGMFGKFLEDHRVSESERTAQRMMVIYKNYRHMLDNEDKNKVSKLTGLGVTHLLELRKLPDRFKKEIEIIREKPEGEVKEMVAVIDEEKLTDFLNGKVKHEGKMVYMRDLPVSKMKRYINEAQGIFEPSGTGEDDSVEAVVDDDGGDIPDASNDPEIQANSDRLSKIIDGFVNLSERVDKATKMLDDNLDKLDMSGLPSTDADELKKVTKDTISKIERLMMKLMDIKDKV